MPTEIEEQIRLVFSEDVSIEIRLREGQIFVWRNSTGTGFSTMYDALEDVRAKLGHAQVKYIRTIRSSVHGVASRSMPDISST